MKYDARQKEIIELESEMRTLQERLRTLRLTREPQPVENHRFLDKDGSPVHLLDLFHGRDELFVVHNMGKRCAYCTLWGDTLNGVLPHIESRAAFAVSSPDSPEVMSAFAAGRGWNFTMVSLPDESFAAAMDYLADHGVYPGVSVFRREGDQIFRVNNTDFGPGDIICGIWHLFDLLPGGSEGWAPRFSYEEETQ